MEEEELQQLLAQQAPPEQMPPPEPQSAGPHWAAGLAALGAGLSGKDPTAAGQNILKMQQEDADNTPDEFSKNIGLKLGLSPEVASKLSRSSLKQNGPYFAKIMEVERKKQEDQTKMKQNLADNTPNDLTRELGTRLKISPGNLEKLTPSSLKQNGPYFQKLLELEEKKVGDKQKADEGSRQRLADRKEMADYRHELQMDSKQEGKKLKDQELIEEVENRRQEIENNLNDLETMVGDKGTYELLGAHNEILGGKLNAVATDTAKLFDPKSVARPSEVEQAMKALFKPRATGMTNETAIKILKQYRNDMNRRADTAYKVRGITPPSRPNKVAESRPKQIVQNGHTYTLNQQGEYE